MLEKIVALDKQFFIFLNNLGSPAFDNFWLNITKPIYWTPFFLLISFLIYKKKGLKNLGILLVFIAVLILFTDQTANFFKHHFERLRPCNDPTLSTFIRIPFEKSGSFSFYSGHATNSMATMTLVFLIINKYYKATILLFLYPLLFGFSRIYLGLHFPLDILTGYFFGILYALLFYKLYQYFQFRFFR